MTTAMKNRAEIIKQNRIKKQKRHVDATLCKHL